MIDSMRLYGRAMMDHYHGEPGRLVIERDDGYRDVNDCVDLFAPYREWRTDERVAIRFAKGEVLDVGCGPGRASLYLQRRGLRVTAIDVSPEALEVAKLRGVKNVMLMDARHLTFPPRSFDAFVMFGNNFGMCGDFTATKRLLRRLAAIARPKARLIASTRTPGSWIPHHANYVMSNVRKGRPPGLVRIRMEYDGEIGSWFKLLLVSPDDTMRLCLSAGWEVIKILPSHGGVADYSFVAELPK